MNWINIINSNKTKSNIYITIINNPHAKNVDFMDIIKKLVSEERKEREEREKRGEDPPEDFHEKYF